MTIKTFDELGHLTNGRASPGPTPEQHNMAQLLNLMGDVRKDIWALRDSLKEARDEIAGMTLEVEALRGELAKDVPQRAVKPAKNERPKRRMIAREVLPILFNDLWWTPYGVFDALNGSGSDLTEQQVKSALHNLESSGYVARPRQNTYRITDAGRAWLAQKGK